MRLTKIIKEFAFEEINRAKIILGAGTRLNPVDHHLQLIADSDGEYPLDVDLYAKSWVANPLAVKQWLGFQVSATQFAIDGVTVTSLGFRLSNDTNQYYWNGAAWEINVADWNTEAEIAANISTFDVTARKIQVVVNLKTTDAAVTPLLHSIKVLYDGAIEFSEDLVYRSLVPILRTEIRPIGRFRYEMPATSDKISLASITTPYNITGIDSVFDHDNDADHFTDLFQSYDSGAEEITLTGSLTLGTVVHIRFYYEPEIAVTTSQDYNEIGKVPAVVLDDINLVDATEMPSDDSVLDVEVGEGWKVKAPIRGDLEITMRLVTDKGIDLTRLADEAKRFFSRNQILTSVGLDEDYRLWLLNEYDMSTTANKSDIHSARLTFRVVGVLFYGKEAEQAYAVQRFNLSGDMDITVS